MGGVSIRVCLVNTGIQTFLPHGNGLLFAKNDSLPLRIFFCKGSVGITKRQTGNGKSSSNGVERICCSLICLIACQHAGKAKNIPWASRKA